MARRRRGHQKHRPTRPRATAGRPRGPLVFFSVGQGRLDLPLESRRGARRSGQRAVRRLCSGTRSTRSSTRPAVALPRATAPTARMAEFLIIATASSMRYFMF